MTGLGLPDGVLGEGLQGFPVGDPLDGGDGLGDGVFLDVEDQCGDPLTKRGCPGRVRPSRRAGAIVARVTR